MLDNAYRTTGISAGAALNLSGAQYDANGNLFRRSNNGIAEIYGYDSLNRLTTADGAFGARGYQYDDNGNRLGKQVDGSPVTYTYGPASNRQATVDGITVALDDNGNILNDGNYQYGFTAHNRLSQASAATTVVARYRYNGLGQRTAKTVGDRTVYFRYGLSGELLVELDDAGVVRKEYIYLNGQPLALLAAASTAPAGPPQEHILDNGDAAFSVTGNWTGSTGVAGYLHLR